MNISELARQLHVEPELLRQKLPELGFDVGSHAIKIDDQVVEKVRQTWRAFIKNEDLKKRLAHQLEERARFGDAKNDGVSVAAIALSENMTVSEFAERLKLPIPKVVAELMKNGVMAALNDRIDFDTAYIIAEDLGYHTVRGSDEATPLIKKQKEQRFAALLSAGDEETRSARPPVVVVMGHVDHGKTKLLDAIRKTDVVDAESSGITQHIGAYQAYVHDRTVTFLDTPGHEAFSAMRVRGGHVADVAILVVAADDGVRPQTIESLSVMQQEGLPFVIAINKIDKEGADVERVKKELSELNVIPEDWGGKTIFVPISAKQGTGIRELLDRVLLVVDLEDLKASRSAPGVGTVIESHVDKGMGPVLTVLVQNGTLRVGDSFHVGETGGKIKAMKNFLGHNIVEACPSVPAQILGVKDTPSVGDIFEVVSELDTEKIRKKAYRLRVSDLIEQHAAVKKSAKNEHGKNEQDDEKNEKRVLRVILRTDVLGSLEAILGALHNFEDAFVRVDVVRKGLGSMTEQDIALAESTGALLIGFRVTMSNSAKQMYHTSVGVSFQNYAVIYDLLEDVKAKLVDLLPVEIIEHELGKATVKALFKAHKDGQIIGGVVTSGKIAVQAHVRVFRKGIFISEGNVLQLQSNRRDVQEVKDGSEFGSKILCDLSFQEGDVLDLYEREERKRMLGNV